jgi:membrane-associated protease RseP (regulator of RpoE activity)
MSASATATAPAWRTNLYLFLATIASVFVTGVVTDGSVVSDGPAPETFRQELVAFFRQAWMLLHNREALAHGGQFAGTLLTILVAHELGHYVAARIHKVEASLPFFIPLPIVSPFGTMGAVIRMRGVIPTRRALLDIGASGPLAGLVFAIPLYAWGVSHSIVKVVTGPAATLGESFLLRVLDSSFGPHVPEGSDVVLSPVAFGAWGGMFVTMINLFPIGQLDGGHVAYALLGPRQDRYARLVHRAMLAFFFLVVIGHVWRDVAAGTGLYNLGKHLANAVVWIVWFQLLAILGMVSARSRDEDPAPGSMTIRMRLAATVGLVVIASIGRDQHKPLLPLAFFAGLGLLLAMEVKGGVLKKHALLDHPATGSEPLGPVRAGVAILTLIAFVLLFMPEPFSM